MWSCLRRGLFLASSTDSVIMTRPPGSPIGVLTSLDAFGVTSSGLSTTSFSPECLDVVVTRDVVTVKLTLP